MKKVFLTVAVALLAGSLTTVKGQEAPKKATDKKVEHKDKVEHKEEHKEIVEQKAKEEHKEKGEHKEWIEKPKK